jgi:hypothetical protein
MRKSVYTSKRESLVAQRDQLRASLDSVERRIDALDVVWNEVFCLPNANQESSVKSESSFDPGDDCDNPGGSLKALSETIEEIALAQTGEFGVQQVVEQLAQRGHPDANRSTISGRLAQLLSDGRLVQTVKGQGRRGSVYRLPVKSMEQTA